MKNGKKKKGKKDDNNYFKRILRINTTKARRNTNIIQHICNNNKKLKETFKDKGDIF